MINAQDLTKCTVCSVEFSADEQPEVMGYFGIIPVAFCAMCTACLYDLAQTLTDTGTNDEESASDTYH